MTEAITLAEQDKHGPPYVLPWPADRTYELALQVARSKHPSRVLANTNGYRFGRFTEQDDGTVQVHMFGEHIATYTPEGVRVWTQGYRTTSTTEALNNLVSGGMFYQKQRVVYFGRYVADDREDVPVTEGMLIPYRSAS